jgi:kynureninase
MDLPFRVGAAIARIVGAEPDRVVVADSTSANLFKLLSAALDLRPGRTTIVTDAANFPTDLYVAEGLARLRGQGCRVVAADDPIAALDSRTAVLALTQVDYRSGARRDIAADTARAHAAGALALWDLSHSAGAVPLSLRDWNVDLAVGCGYKFLNGGPGAPAFLYVAPRHDSGLRTPLQGWLGHAAPFDFSPEYRPAPGVARMVAGTPPILSLAALEVGVATFDGIGVDAVAAKSASLSALFLDLMRALPAFRPLTPRDPARRGSQVAFAHPDAYPIVQALIADGVVGDFRAPDTLRFGLAPLYTRHADVWDAVAALRRIMDSGAWRDPAHQLRKAVT